MQKTKLFDPMTLGAPEPVKTITLRPYQEEARDAVLKEWNEGRLDTLIAASVGSGKTEMFLGVLAEVMGPNDRAIILAHRLELVQQPRDRILHHWPMLGTPGIVMANQNECRAKIVIATVQTLSSNGRLDRIIKHGKISYLIVDEAHHATAETYKDIIQRLREHNPALKHLGVTATPRRTDGDGLSQIYQTVAYRASIKDMIKAKALCPFTAIGIKLPVTLAGIRKTSEGWDNEELGNVLKVRNAEEIIVETWEKHAKERPTLAFTASVVQAHSLAERFREYGYAFYAVDATTPKDERKALIQQFLARKIQGLVNVGIFTEGTDLPLASCMVQVKPTKSDLCYVQMAGRIFRIAPGKPDALILDFVPLGARDMRLAGDLLGKPKVQRDAEEKAEDQDIILSCFGINSQGEGIDGDPDQVQLEILNYLSSSQLSWVFDGDLASASLGDDGTLAIVMPDDKALARLQKADELKTDKALWSEEWDAEYTLLLGRTKFRLHHIRRHMPTKGLGAFDTWEDASEAANDHCGEASLGVLGRKSSRWRKHPASEKQVALCRKLGVFEPGMTKGQAARATTHHFARKALKLQ